MNEGKRYVSTALGSANVSVCRVTTVTPKILTKQYQLVDGELQKQGGGVLVRGYAEIMSVSGLSGFADLLGTLQGDQALIYGLPDKSPVHLTTKDIWKRTGGTAHTIPRTKDTFSFRNQPGIMMLDYDPEDGGTALSKDEIVSILRSVFPMLVDASFLWWPSASSHIVNEDTTEDLTGLRGQRLYLVVADASDIPRAGAAFAAALWLHGHGYIKISRSGSVLLRTLVDASVWQASRLDFAAGSTCQPPLVQKRGEPVLILGKYEVIDSRVAFPDLSPAEKQKVEAIQRDARSSKSEEAASIRAAWSDARAVAICETLRDDDKLTTVRSAFLRAVEENILTGDFPLHVIEDDQERQVMVQEVLADPERHDGLLTLDPLEPEYDGRRVVGKLFLKEGKPTLFSFAHGGTSYLLLKQRAVIEIVPGMMTEAVEATLAVLQEEPNVFDFGDAIVLIEDGKSYPLNDAALEHHLGGVIQYWHLHYLRSGPVKRLNNPPKDLAKQLLALKARRRLKPLHALITAPTLRPDGTVLQKPGYDGETRLYLALDSISETPIVESPTDERVKDAVEQLFYPFNKFPFVDVDAKGVFLAALLTAVLRGTLGTAPAFGFDAPAQGSGKTLLADCIGRLTSGHPPAVYPPVSGRDDEENRKRIFAALLAGQPAIVLDNLVGTLDSPAIAAALTAPNIQDRVLGRSETLSVPNKALLLMTGNNLALAGDLARRVLVCRIDPKSERPFAREFDLDPSKYVQENRQMLVACALTIIRGYLARPRVRAPGRMASFEKWDDLVRQTVCWIGREIFPHQFGDPMHAVIRAQNEDPEHENLTELLKVWVDLYGDEWISSNELLQKLQPYRYDNFGNSNTFSLAEKLRAINDKALHSATSLGRTLKYRCDRIAGGLRLECSNNPHTKAKRWRVVATDGSRQRPKHGNEAMKGDLQPEFLARFNSRLFNHPVKRR